MSPCKGVGCILGPWRGDAVKNHFWWGMPQISKILSGMPLQQINTKSRYWGQTQKSEIIWGSPHALLKLSLLWYRRKPFMPLIWSFIEFYQFVSIFILDYYYSSAGHFQELKWLFRTKRICYDALKTF